jgi:hypothetical protein
MKRNESWLLLMHQLSPQADSFRVKVWRSLQKIGALQLKNSVYVLPSSVSNQGKLEDVVRKINAGQGDAFLCESKFIDGIDSEQLIQKFNEDRSKRYRLLSAELRELQKLFRVKRISEDSLMQIAHSFGRLERQTGELKNVDFFDCQEGNSNLKLLETIGSRIDELRSGESGKSVSKKSIRDFQARTWVTRLSIHEDRMASIWLISKFIDKKPTFKFVEENGFRPAKNEVRFDMFAAEFTHVGDKCTFEVLIESFGLTDHRIALIAEIIHDLDLKDTKFNRPETIGIGMVIGSIAASEATDKGRVKKASALFDDLLLSFKAKPSLSSARKGASK